ncbi:MFS transporter [Halostagnicola bangensis]
MQWRYRETVLTLCTLAFFITTMGRLGISPLIPEISETFSVSNTIIGLSLTGMWFAYGLAQYPSGLFADRFGERRIIFLSVGGSAIVIFAASASPFFGLFFLAVMLLGGVAGLHYSVATTLLSRTHDEVGTAIGVHNSGATVAGLLAPLVFVWIAVRFGWRVSIATAGLLAVPIAVLFAWKIREMEPRHSKTPFRERVLGSEIRGILTRPSILFTLIIATICEFVWQGTATFLPTFFVEYHDVSTTFAGGLFSVYFLIQAFGQISVGAVSDRIGCDKTIAGCMLTGVIGFCVLVMRSDLLSFMIGVTFIGVAMSFASALLPRFLNVFAVQEENIGLGLVRTIYMIVASLGSVMVGLFADLFGWEASITFLVVLLASVFVALSVNWLLRFGY